MAPRRRYRWTPAVPPAGFKVPEGWIYVSEVKRNGRVVKYYTNVLRQKFYTEADLLRNIKYSKEHGLNLFAPNFKPPTSGPFAPRRQSQEPSTSKKGKEIERSSEIECASALLDLSVDQHDEVQECAYTLLQISVENAAPENNECRSSRRLMGHQPELQNDFDRPLEYILKDKARGLFEIMCFSGSFSPVGQQDKFARSGVMSISLSAKDGRVLGAPIGGPTIAASPVEVFVVSFLMESTDMAKGKKPKFETRVGAGVEGSGSGGPSTGVERGGSSSMRGGPI